MIHRKLLKGLLLLGSLLAGQAYALGLGNITLQSHLNEPLTAQIQLVAMGDLSANEVLVNLAPQEDFDKAMVERSYLLNGLLFQLDFSDSRNPAIIVTTSDPIREPSLNFIVELRSPSGRVLREYTLLLDIAQGGMARDPMRRPAVVVKRAPAAQSQSAPAAAPVVSPAAPVAAPATPPVPSAVDTAADAAAKAALTAQLVGAQEQANLVVAENEALKKQAADLEKQLADATAQLNNQNAQLQAMKVELDAAIAAKQAAALSTATPSAPAAVTRAPAATEPAVAPTAPVAVTVPPQSTEVVQPAVAKTPALASEPVAQPESGGSWGTVLIAVVIVLLVAVGLWAVRKRQQQGEGEQEAASVTEGEQEPDSEVDAMLTQFGTEHSAAPQQEAIAAATEDKSLTTDEALDLLLADTDFGLSETPSAAQEEASLVEELAVDELLMTDDALPVAELDDWSADTVLTDAAPIDKDFVFEPELFADSASHEPVVEPAAEAVATQQSEVVDEAFHDATDRDFVVTKLELARQYFEMSDAESARDLLQEVLEEGDEELKQAAADLLQKMS
jgi:FimV-like protein